MDIRYAKPMDDLQSLWSVCFQEDGQEFFAHEYDPSRAIVVTDEMDAPAAMLHWIPQTLRVPGRGGADGGEIEAAYILGVATHPKHRGKGCAGDLVEQALFELYLRNIPLAFLLPCGARMAQFYGRYGFAQTGARLVPETTPLLGETRVTEVTPPVSETLDTLYEEHYSAYTHPRRGAKRWTRIAADYDLRLGDGRYRVYNGETLMEDSRACPSETHGETSACVRAVRADEVRVFLDSLGYDVPEGLWNDPFAPWNGRNPGGLPPETLPGGLPFAANLLYNERVD